MFNFYKMNIYQVKYKNKQLFYIKIFNFPYNQN